ncbi:ABC transporter permease [Desulfocicer niacini]
MFFWIKTASNFLLRSWRSTGLITVMVVSAVSSLIFLSSLAMGVNDTMIKNAVSLFSGHISGMNIPENITEKNLLIHGVAGVLKRIYTPGFLYHGDLMEMVRLISVNPDKEIKFTAMAKKIIKGRYLETHKNEIVLSQTTAEHLNSQPGDHIRFSPAKNSADVELIVAGIYKTGIDQFDRGVSFCTLGAIPIRSMPWQAAIFLDNGVDKDLIAANYRQRQIEDMEFRTWTDLMPDLEQLISLNYLSMGIVIIMVFMVVSFGIACAFSIFILRDIREYGIMKVMGITPMETTFLIFSEVIIINLLASSIGVMMGTTAVTLFQNIGINLSAYTSHNQYFVVSGIIFPRLTPFSIWLPPASALLFSIPAALWPTLFVIKKSPADILRSI